MSDKIISFAQKFLRFAGSFEFNKLRGEKGRNSELWFGAEIAHKNDEKQFAAMDKENIVNILKAAEWISILEGEDINKRNAKKYYLQHPKTQETIHFILRTYDKYFPQIKSERVFQNLENTEVLNFESPIFLLIHDLIHQTLEKEFITNLENQNNNEATLLDELYEDLASSLSNFEPHQPNQGLFSYLNLKFNKELLFPINEETLQKTIEKTFHIAKSELRGKIDQLAKRKTHELNKLDIPRKMKQLVDGILSRLKLKMLENIPVALKHKETNEIGKQYRNLFWAFDLDDELTAWYEKIRESQIIEPADSSALRAWMLECLKKMKELQLYFAELPQELEQEYYRLADEDELEEFD